jgi:hypothetical protein
MTLIKFSGASALMVATDDLLGQPIPRKRRPAVSGAVRLKPELLVIANDSTEAQTRTNS